MLTGKELFGAARQSPSDSAFWWLGQHTFILKIGGRIVLIDPFLTELDDRNVPPLFAPEDAADVVDVVACTHDHLDHIDPAAIPGLAEHTQAVFLAPAAHADRMRSLGVPAERLRLLNDGESIEIGNIRCTAVRAAHEFFHMTDDGRYPFLGYVFEAGGKAAYHAGDTLWWDGLQERLRSYRLDVAFVPINGRDARRLRNDVQGNMTYQEAADLVGGLNVALAVPAHYDMFDWNSEDPDLFADYLSVKYPKTAVWIGRYAQEVPF